MLELDLGTGVVGIHQARLDAPDNNQGVVTLRSPA